jgi:hypothetical protein
MMIKQLVNVAQVRLVLNKKGDNSFAGVARLLLGAYTFRRLAIKLCGGIILTNAFKQKETLSVIDNNQP